ncbi:sigma-70 family RNA polymerase sigma factor [Thermopolyspora sp. NPDC052614]|uniref:sigma-70 family RNA polymerase sigma factor n=1 Tax=Thermopolyspora sp. NPDC052614 TaxID=3155682 RepID=UPI003422C72D
MTTNAPGRSSEPYGPADDGRDGDGPPGPRADGESPASERWESLLLAERDSLHRFVASLAGHDTHLVEDVVQETLLRAWQAAHHLDWRERPIRMWLFRVARNLVIDDRRRSRAVPVGVAADLAALQVIPDEAARALDRRLVVEALRALPAPHRDTLVYVHLLDWTGDDAARALGVPSGTIKSRNHHGLRMLRQRLISRRDAA